MHFICKILIILSFGLMANAHDLNLELDNILEPKIEFDVEAVAGAITCAELEAEVDFFFCYDEMRPGRDIKYEQQFPVLVEALRYIKENPEDLRESYVLRINDALKLLCEKREALELDYLGEMEACNL